MAWSQRRELPFPPGLAFATAVWVLVQGLFGAWTVTLKLYPVPAHRLLALLHFDTLKKSLQAVQHINRHGPAAVETLDKALLDLGLENPNVAPLLGGFAGGGTGLGLYLAQQIVSAHGGTIGYRPREGGGSCFSLWLPIAPEAVTA